jgi:hypothetical protein
LENDFLAFKDPDNNRGSAMDRWRSNAIEYRGQNGLIVGTHIFNNDPESQENAEAVCTPNMFGQMNKGFKNVAYGAWKDGQTYSSPLYIGYRFGNSIEKIGYNHGIFQDITQNFVHRNGFLFLPFGHQHYYNRYDNLNVGIYYYSGWYNQYSIWGR